MCRSKKTVEIRHSLTPKSHTSKSFKSSSSSSNYPSLNYPSTSSSTGLNNQLKDLSTSTFSSNQSVSILKIKRSLPENPHIYDFSEICKATNNFQSRPFSSSSSSTSWRCEIRGKDAILIKRKLRRSCELPELQERLLTVCRSHHSSLVRLMGAATSGNYIYLVYDYVHGANLAACLRNPQNPSYTVLSSWLSRMQVATDIAHGLDYIHHCSGLDSHFVHNHIKSSSILVTEDSLNAKICHFGASELCGELLGNERSSGRTLSRSNSKGMKIEGTRGYMAPEFQATGTVTQKCDVYAFGVVVLELVSGQEPLKYVFDEGSGAYRRISVINMAKEAVASGGGGVRKWVDKRLKDSFPVDVAEKMVLVGLECVEEDPEKRSNMELIAVKVSKLFLDSQTWAESIGMPTDFSVSMAPR